MLEEPLLLPVKQVQVGEIPAQIRVTGEYRKSLGLSTEQENELSRKLTGQDMSLFWFLDTSRVRELLNIQKA